MIIDLPIKPLSINTAYRGRRFKTPEYQDYTDDVLMLLPRRHEKIEGELFVRYVFYVKNYDISDVDNMIKTIQDILVKGQIIKDDRYIKVIECRKEKVMDINDERIHISIEPYREIA